MNQIEWILYLLRDDLDDRQAAKLQSVLENVLQVHRSIPPLDDIIGKFERAKRIVKVKCSIRPHVDIIKQNIITVCRHNDC